MATTMDLVQDTESADAIVIVAGNATADASDIAEYDQKIITIKKSHYQSFDYESFRKKE
jgi:ribosomal silencing factor RsfS